VARDARVVTATGSASRMIKLRLWPYNGTAAGDCLEPAGRRSAPERRPTNAEQRRQTAEDFTTAISRFHGIHLMRSSEAERGVHAPGTRTEASRSGRGEIANDCQALARGESKKARGELKSQLRGLKPTLVRLDPERVGLDPAHGRLDLRLFRSDEHRFRADQPRVRPNQQRGGLEMAGVESDASEFQSAHHVVRLNETHVDCDAPGLQSHTPGLQSDASECQSDELQVGPKVSGGGSDASGFRLKQARVRLAVAEVGLKIVFFRLKPSGCGLKV
jgi:hypothetical protein